MSFSSDELPCLHLLQPTRSHLRLRGRPATAGFGSLLPVACHTMLLPGAQHTIRGMTSADLASVCRVSFALQAANLTPKSGWLAWRPDDAALQAALMEAAVLLVASVAQRARVLQAKRKQVGTAASYLWAAEAAPHPAPCHAVSSCGALRPADNSTLPCRPAHPTCCNPFALLHRHAHMASVRHGVQTPYTRLALPRCSCTAFLAGQMSPSQASCWREIL